MANKAKHAFGSRSTLQSAIESGKVDAYDVLFLKGENEAPAVGWIDKQGNPVIVECGVQYVEGASLPTEGKQGIVYIFENEGYIWDGAAFVEMAKTADLSALEAEIAKKVDEETVDSKIEEAVGSSLSIVEF